MNHIDYFVEGEIYLSSTGKQFRFIDYELKADGVHLKFQSIGRVVNKGVEVKGHKMSLYLSQVQSFKRVTG